MVLSPEDVKSVIKDAFKEHLKEHGDLCGRCCTTCDLTPGEHRDHHQALRGAFSVRRQVLSAFVKVAATGAIIWMGASFWDHLKTSLGK